MYNPEFDEIRPYNDNELPAVFEALAVDPHFRKMAQYVYPNEPYEVLVQKMKACKTKLEFQKITSYPFI
ncbi:MAG: acyltransferase, partial [Bacteroidaceae bacterium]|nr:acyltransferase [Bacteroidaceae bacterium]